MKTICTSLALCLLVCTWSCSNGQTSGQDAVRKDTVKTSALALELPEPYATKSSRNFSKVIGWPEGKTPVAPAGFTVSQYASGLKSCRWLYVLPNGDVLVSQANTEPKGIKKVLSDVSGHSQSEHVSGSPDQVMLLRDANKDGIPELKEVFVSGIHQPFGMLLIGTTFYVAGTDGLFAFDYNTGDTKLKGSAKKILELPAGGYNNHWTRNIVANADNSKIYVSVGSGSNVGEHGMENELRRAGILEINPDGSGERVYASGLRNPVGMAWAPGSNMLWTAVNERDGLGDDLVPDYITSVKDGGFYGWPYSYYGQHPDPRFKDSEQRMDLVNKALVPDVPLRSHTASLGLAFYTKSAFPVHYRDGAFVGQHGSWNRKELSGYKVVFVPFRNSKPADEPEDFLTGFIADAEKSEVYGRPVGVAVLPDGSLLVTDDASDTIWRVAYQK